MRFDQAILRGLLILIVLSMSVATPLVAQKATQGGTLHQRADALIVDLQARAEKLRELQANLASAQGERRAIYRNELLRRWDAFALKLDELVSNLGNQAKKGIEHAEQRDAAKTLTTAVAAGLSDAALVREEAIVKLEDKRSAAKDEEKIVLSREISRENVIYQKILTSIVDNIERMKLLGIDSKADEESVDRLLQRRAEILAGRLRLTLTQRNEVRELLRSAGETTKPTLQEELSTVSKQLTSSAESLRAILDQMDRRGLVTTEWRE